MPDPSIKISIISNIYGLEKIRREGLEIEFCHYPKGKWKVLVLKKAYLFLVLMKDTGGYQNYLHLRLEQFRAKAVDARSLMETIRQALSIPDFKIRCGSQGRRIVAEKFNFDAQVRQIEEIIERYV
jgi:hypothetical protein